MLVLSRQCDQTIVIGDNIEITVVSIRGDKVRLGINAPREITVHRKEVYEAIQQEKANGNDRSLERIPRSPQSPQSPRSQSPRHNGRSASGQENRRFSHG